MALSNSQFLLLILVQPRESRVADTTRYTSSDLLLSPARADVFQKNISES